MPTTFLIRKTELDVNSLYHREGAYHYTKGINPRAILALVLGVVIALVGLAVKPLHFLYDYAWFVGFFAAGIVYAVTMRLAAPTNTAPTNIDDAPRTRTGLRAARSRHPTHESLKSPGVRCRASALRSMRFGIDSQLPFCKLAPPPLAFFGTIPLPVPSINLGG